MSDSVCTRVETITEQEDKNLAGATKETRNDLTVIIPENPFPEIEVDAYPPLKFSWVVPKKIAAMAFPRSRQNLQYLLNQGIRNLVTLTTDTKPPIDDFLQVIKWVEIPIEEFDIPNVEQISKFIEVCEAAEKVGQAVGVHCRQGRARSGVMVAAYMVRFHHFLPDQAVALIRDLRTGSCEYPEHEEAVVQYYKHLTKDNPGTYGVTPEKLNEVAETARAFNKRK